MVFCNWKKQNRKGFRLTAAVLAGVLFLTVPLTEPVTTAFAAEKTTAYLPTGGLIAFTTEKAVALEKAGGSSSLFSIRPELRQYDWDCYSSDYFYSKLSAKERLLYERLDAACGELLTSSTLNASAYSVRGGGTCYGTKTVSCLGLSLAQVEKVRTIFAYANPQYYFLNGNLLMPNSESCAIRIYDAFADGSSRAAATRKVLARLEELQARIIDNGNVYETEAQIHELLCNELTYMEDENVLSDKTDPYYTQTVYGALTTGATVCAGYTKLYSMLCNYFGIDCISITHYDSENQNNNHSWNQVRYGDHWYIVDVTWDDYSRDRARYFHVTDQQMTQIDQDRMHVPSAIYAGIRPAADTQFSGGLMLMQGLGQPGVEIRDTAPGVTITMTAERGDIYYTLDGTTPGADDLYTGPVELTDGGTYVVTAVAALGGTLPSAYEIFTVRIAGGSVSISSAANVTGKKIKLKYKSAKSYTGYEISYASKKDFSNQKTSKVKSKAVTISGLKKGKTYYIRVRGYKTDAYGNYYYTPYSKTKKVTVTK